jgi:quercetin dioxygenase-like cupin family protein
MATNTQTNKNVFETEIPLTSIDHIELSWHTDGATRFMQVLEGVGWKFQFKDEPAREVGPGTSIHINKNSIHKLIKGSTDLKVRIVEL